MVKQQQTQISINLELPGASAKALQNRQSVRATFKLSADCIDALSIVATHMGIRQKSLFDHLVEDLELLNSMALEMKSHSWEPQFGIQKTYVISRGSLSALNQIAKTHGVPRDALIELSVRRLIPIIAQQQQDYAERKKVLDKLNRHYAAGVKIKSQVDRLFGRDDALRSELTHVMESYAACLANLQRFVEKGKQIEEFEAEFHLGDNP
ncbi:MAG: hypothetical protein WBG37_05790 [Desulfobacterales bacterium]|jgi:hypothetical protein